MPFVTPRSTTTTGTGSGAGAGSGGRATFRPPWVKDDAGTASSNSAAAAASKPWAKKAAATKENGEKSATATATATTNSKAKAAPTTDTKKPAEPAKKTAAEPVKKATATTAAAAAAAAKKNAEPVKKSLPEPVKKSAPEPVKKVATSLATKGKPAAKKKEPTPPPESSSEEEESEEEEEEETEEETESEEEESEEEESEEEDEDDDDDDDDKTLDAKVPEHVKKAAQLRPTPINKKPEQQESELTQRFTLEKPKLRSVVVKRDKSMKKIAPEDDDEAVEGETEDERERRLRFKLEKPKLRHVKREEKPLPSKSTDDLAKLRPVLKKVPKVDEILKEPKEEPKPEFKTKTLRKAPSIKNVPAPPPLPTLVPKAPPPPPPPLMPGEKRVLSDTQKQRIEKLKTRPRRRPDWSEMMKEVESGKKLRHVACNDRSQPILTCKSMTKVDDKFIYETEKDNSHNKLLKQIQGGIRLKPTQTNDRSKPILGGLRKFRRQMTIEEQLHKSQSKINMLSEAPSSHALGPNSSATMGAGSSRPSIASGMSIDEESPDELDDIDKIRDDLQSTKQMLALELRNREAQDRENKKLLAKIRTLETELEREKSREKNLEYGSNVIVATMDPTPTTEQAYVNSLKREVDDARKVSKEVEKNYHDTSTLLVEAKLEIEEQKRQIQLLERKLAAALQGNTTPSTNRSHISFRFAYDDDDDDDYNDQVNGNHQHGNHGLHKGGTFDGTRRPSEAHFGRDSSPELDLELSESDPDEPEEKKTERREKRMGKEVKVLRSKLTKLKVKEEAAKKEKDVLKQAMKKNHVLLKEEKKKFKKLEKEVQKMAASMKLDEDEVDAEEKDDEEEAEEEQEQEEESEEESEESESEESEEEPGSESEAEDAANSAKKSNLDPRVKKHESRFAALKKCNVLLQANVDNLQDQISQVRSRATNLQDELDAVIAELGF